MAAVNAANARKNLCRLIKEVSDSHEPLTITGRDNSAVLAGEDDWRAIQETLHLLSIPGMAEPIRKGLKTPVERCDAELNSCELPSRLHEAGAARRRETRPPRSETGPVASAQATREGCLWPPAEVEKLHGDPAGAYSRRINIQHRLVYQVLEQEKAVKVPRMWTHYE